MARISLVKHMDIIVRPPRNKRLFSFLVYLFWSDHHRYHVAAFNSLRIPPPTTTRQTRENNIGTMITTTQQRRQSSILSSFLSSSASTSTSFTTPPIPVPIFLPFFSKGTKTATSLFSSSSSCSSSSTISTRLGRKITQYTIDDSICLPTKGITLKTSVHKACRSLDIYLDKKPSLPHTRDAFKVLLEMIEMNNDNNSNNNNSSSITTVYDGIVLDSGCGTGRSTKILARDIYPHHLVIGVDRSFSRLTKTKDNRQSLGADIDVDGNVDGDGDVDGDVVGDSNGNSCGDVDDTTSAGDETYCQQISENAYLVRAELVEFWECCIDHGWTTSISDDCTDTDDENNNSDNRQKDEPDNKVNETSLKITHHYMLYPNPYPTKKRLMQRWYAHPCFPLILKLNVETMVIRSNWEVYLDEFAAAIEMANDFYDHNNSTNFVGNDSDVSSWQGRTSSSSSSSSSSNNLALPYLSSAKVGPIERIDKSVALTNFEAKFDNVGESTYELILKRK